MSMRPEWCPNKSCDCLRTMQDKVCAGYTDSGGRLCILPGKKAQDICALIDLDEADTNELAEMIETIDGMHVAYEIASGRGGG